MRRVSRSFERAAALALALALGLASGKAAGKETQTGRAEALIFATTFGFYEGIAATILLAEHDILNGSEGVVFGGAALTLLTTGGTYFAASKITETYGVNEAQASIFNSSLFWAVLNGAGAGVSLDADLDAMIWSTLATGWAGQAAGILTASNVDRTAGQVGLMNTIGTWTGAEALLIMGAAGVEEGYSFWGTIAVDVGLAAGVFLSSNALLGRGVSQERARLLDLGAFCGGLAGPAALFMVWGPEENFRTWYLSAVAIGIPAGIGTAWYLTRNYDRDDPDAEAEADKIPLIVPLAAGRF